MIDEAAFDPTKEQWCWMPSREACGAVFGPFDSREDCLADALHEEGPGVKIHLGQPKQTNPVHYVPTDLDTMLDAMNETFDDAEGNACDDDPAFDVPDHEAAQKALEEALGAWAAKYVVPGHAWWVTCEEDATT